MASEGMTEEDLRNVARSLKITEISIRIASYMEDMDEIKKAMYIGSLLAYLADDQLVLFDGLTNNTPEMIRND